MKRFDMEVQPDRSYYGEGERWEVNPYEIANGDWVKWDDVQELVDTLKEARGVVNGAADYYLSSAYIKPIRFGSDEYTGYLVMIRKIDNVLNKIEVTT